MVEPSKVLFFLFKSMPTRRILSYGMFAAIVVQTTSTTHLCMCGFAKLDRC